MEKETNQQGDMDSWDNFVSGNFLKAVNVESESDAFVVISIEPVEMDGTPRPRVHLERNGSEFDFDLNKTNSVKVKELGIESPRALVGKKLYFKKALVRNPRTNMEVEGLRIHKVE